MGTDSNAEHTAQVARLYADHHAPLNRFITKKMHQPEEAEDVVQEAFARLINNDSSAARGIASASLPVAYLYRIASNLAIDRLRQQKARADEGVREQLDDTLENPQSGPAQRAASDERLAQLKHAIGDLPPRRRQVFVLHKFRQMSYREVALHLGISVSMVEKHMMKALAQLADELREGSAMGAEIPL